jgi:hypothetical protein
MQRKKWTPKEEITEALLKFREKRKWQLALRRYILEKKPSIFYAPYFGLDVDGCREWIELQFTADLNWANFAKAWQFDHVVPTNYFDFDNGEDLKLCWNFINIRVDKLEPGKNSGSRVDLLSAKPYFQDLYNKTGYGFCLKMIDKISAIEISNMESHPEIEGFLINNKEKLETIASLSQEEFEKFNRGSSLKDILLERAILKKFGT